MFDNIKKYCNGKFEVVKFLIECSYMNKINIENNGWVLEVDLNGGRIVNLIKDGQKMLGTYQRIDGKTGNTHVCIPNFAAEGVEKFGYVFHGPFRKSEWKLMCQNKNSVEISLEIDGLLVIQSFEISDQFKQKVLVRNVGGERKRVHVAIHNYWDTKFGWGGIKLNGHDITGGFVDNPEIKLEKNNILEIPKKKTIEWQVDNFKKAKLWTGMKEENGKRMFDEKYVCIEPEMEYEGFVETNESWLDVGKEIDLEQRISL